MSSNDSTYFSNLPPRRGSSADDVIRLMKSQNGEALQSGSLLKNLLKESAVQKETKRVQPEYPSNGIWHIEGITLDSNFDSGNLANVEYNAEPISDEDSIDRRQGRRPTPDFEFRAWVAPDMAGTEFENKNKSWFHFKVQGASGKCIRFNMMNLNKHQKLFNQGMMPVVMSARAGTPIGELPNILENPDRWSRVNHAFSFTHNGDFILSFWHRFTTNYDYYFSLTYPCSVRDQTEYISRLEKRYSNHRFIYFHRELLCQSYDSNPVELITISSYEGIRDETEPSFAHNLPPPLPTLANAPIPVVDPRFFVECEGSDEDAEHVGDNRRSDARGTLNTSEFNKTARKFDGKRVYIISARVHPGETPASHVMKGCLDFLLRMDDQRADALRNKFIFKIIPIINPDGVIRGHYRTDARGQNLNRYYTDPDKNLQPQCYAYRQMVSYFSKEYKVQGSPVFVSGDGDDSENLNETMDSGVAFLIDLHAHAAKRGCFLYGNKVKSPKLQAEILLYARLTSANSAFMDFDGCVFSQRNMTLKEKRDENLSKEGSARVAFYYLTGSPHIYTLECNYNTGKFMNSIASGRNGRVTPPLPTMPNLKYTPKEYAEVGRGLLCATLDIFDSNPLPRVAPNQVKALRAQIHRQVVNQRQNGKGKITSKSTAQHVISSDRLARRSSGTQINQDKPQTTKTTGVKKISHFRPCPEKSEERKSESRRKKFVSKLPQLKPKSPSKHQPQAQQPIPQNNITFSFLDFD